MNEVMAPTKEVQMQACSISDVCRLCASLHEIMIPIYADEGLVHMLESKIKTHLPFINICENDILPKRVCYHCASAILVWNEVYETSSDADQKLRNICEVNSFDQEDQSKHVPFEEDTPLHVEGILPAKNFIGQSIHFEDVTNENLFSKHLKLNKTLNELDKVPSTSKSDNILLNHESKSPVIQQDERLNPALKSESPNIFDGVEEDGVDEEDHNMYLNAAGIDDDITMNGHRLENISGEEDCGDLIPKDEFLAEVTLHDVDESEVYQENSAPECTANVINLPNDLAMITNTSVTLELIKTDENTGCRRSARNIKKKLQDSKIGVNGMKTVPCASDINGGKDNDENCNKDNALNCNNIDDDEDEGQPLGIRRLLVGEGLARDILDEGDDEDDEKMCQICATVFKTRYNLLRHFQKRHPEYKMYECDLCRISFPSIEEFKDHLEEKHSKVHHMTNALDCKEVRFACDVCGNMYKNKASAMNHLLTHTAKKTVNCTQCDFTCFTKQQLGVHQTKHDKRFVCEICHKRFAQKSQLDVHVSAVHYNQRPYSCALCNKSFKTKGSHDAHMVVHTDTRNYQCPHCEKKCRKRYDLTLHIRTHTGEKPFKCSVCGRGFVQRCDTRKHEMLHFRPGKRKNMFFVKTTNVQEGDDD